MIGGEDKTGECPEKDTATYWKQQGQAWRRRAIGLLEVYLCEYCQDDLDETIDDKGLSWLPDHNCNIANLYGLTCRRAKYILQDADREGVKEEISLVEKEKKIKALRE